MQAKSHANRGLESVMGLGGLVANTEGHWGLARNVRDLDRLHD